MPPQLGDEKNLRKGDAPAIGDEKNLRKGDASAIGDEKTSVKEMIKPPQRRSPQLEMEKKLRQGDLYNWCSNLRKGDTLKIPPIVSRYCFSKHG